MRIISSSHSAILNKAYGFVEYFSSFFYTIFYRKVLFVRRRIDPPPNHARARTPCGWALHHLPRLVSVASRARLRHVEQDTSMARHRLPLAAMPPPPPPPPPSPCCRTTTASLLLFTTGAGPSCKSLPKPALPQTWVVRGRCCRGARRRDLAGSPWQHGLGSLIAVFSDLYWYRYGSLIVGAIIGVWGAAIDGGDSVV
jgi:hypothetical protein